MQLIHHNEVFKSELQNALKVFGTALVLPLQQMKGFFTNVHGCAALYVVQKLGSQLHIHMIVTFLF